MLNRFFVDDPTKNDPRALLTTAKMAAVFDIVTKTDTYIKCSGRDALTLDTDFYISVNNSVFKNAETELTAANLDAGTFEVGKDYYLYVCDTGGLNEGIVKISLNSTFPNGFTASTSRKIGGFHYGLNRVSNAALQPVNTAGVAFGAGWEANIYNGIVPASVWTLKHRPRCAPEGMVCIGDSWIDIYLSSDNGAGGLKSTYNSTPITGTEGLSWYDFNERALTVGKRLPGYHEWLRAAVGSPEGLGENNTNAWTSGTARQLTGYVSRAVSSVGCIDCVGNVWEWLNNLTINSSGRVLSGTTNAVSYTYNDRFLADGVTRPTITNGTNHGPTTRVDAALPGQGAINWDRVSPFIGYGNIFEYYDQNLLALMVGGNWNGGAEAGARTVGISIYTWNVSSGSSARGVCNNL